MVTLGIVLKTIHKYPQVSKFWNLDTAVHMGFVKRNYCAFIPCPLADA